MQSTLKVRSKIIVNAIKPFMLERKKVLDIGCGNAVVSKEIQENLTCNLTGTDILDYRLSNIMFKQMSNEDRLDFNDGEFDIGLFNDVLHHISFDVQIKLIKDALRVCRDVLIFEIKPTRFAKVFDYLINQIHNPQMAILLTHRDKDGWTAVFRDNNIQSAYYDVDKTVFWYPFTHYLFHLKSER